MTDEEKRGVNELVGKLNIKENEIVELEKENRLVKSLLYCTKETCDNCGFVNCENFQRQRTSNPCALYISYKDRIKHLEKENEELKAYNEKLLDGDIEKHNKIVELEKSIQKKKFIIDQLNVQLEEVEKENNELKEKNKWYSEQVCNKECAETWEKLTKAKDILRIGIEGIKREFLFDVNGNRPFAHEAIELCNQFCEQAEQFLKEE